MQALNHFTVRLETNTQKIMGNKYKSKSLCSLSHTVVQKLELHDYVILGLKSARERCHHVCTLDFQVDH